MERTPSVQPHSSRPVVFLIPGLMCDEAVWASQVPTLAERAELRIPRHGLADSLGLMAEAVIGSAPARFALVGHSMGGRVALEIMRRVPERVTALALLDTNHRPRDSGEAGAREAQGRWALVELARREGMRAVGRRWLEIPMVHPDRLHDHELIETILAMIERSSPEQLEAQVRALLARPDATDVLGRIRCPTLVLCGAQDAWCGLSVHRDMAALIPNSSLVSIPHCGHMATLERPRQVSEALRDWLAAAGPAQSAAQERAAGEEGSRRR